MLKQQFSAFINSELKGWTTFDIAWISLATIIILGVSLSIGDSALGIFTSIMGTWCVIMMGRGKRSTFIFGLFNIMCYAYIAYDAKYYGEVMLNILCFLPLNIAGWFMWQKYMNAETGEVSKQQLTHHKRFFLYFNTVITIVLYGFFLESLNGNLPYHDSATTVMSIVAQLLSLWRLTEQWILWIVIDIISIYMWYVNFMEGAENISILLMWMVYLVNAIIMYFRWHKESVQHEV